MKPAIAVFLSLTFGALAQTRGPVADYAVLLSDAPVAQTSQSRMALQTAAGRAQIRTLRNAQQSVIAELQRRNLHVRGTSQILLNAVFVSATREEAIALRSIPGVAHVVPAPPAKR